MIYPEEFKILEAIKCTNLIRMENKKEVQPKNHLPMAKTEASSKSSDETPHGCFRNDMAPML